MKGGIVLAGIPGLEPELTEPETVGLPITPYPIRLESPRSKGQSRRTSAHDNAGASLRILAVTGGDVTSVSNGLSGRGLRWPSGAKWWAVVRGENLVGHVRQLSDVAQLGLFLR